jgi:aryl-alcohol dehydrogenase-like predicted oxidoreductase
MQKNKLGKTGLNVTRLCLGTLPMGRLQKKMSPEQGAQVIKHGVELGINFLDTAMGYGSHEHVRLGLGKKSRDIIISTKSPVETEEEMEKAVAASLKELGRDYIDIFLIHGGRATDLFKAREGALNALVKAKQKGLIRVIGISTHFVDIVKEASSYKEIEVIHPMINLTGIGIMNGSRDDMAQAIKKAHAAGKGIFAMKIFAGGGLLERYDEALTYVLDLKGIDSIAVGMVNKDEVDYNFARFSGKIPDKKPPVEKKQFYVMPFCKGCLSCHEVCPAEAILTVDDKSFIDQEECTLCGYCVDACPDLWIRMI